MKCPNCGSESIVWDYQRGYSVCTSCGLVIEALFEEFLWASDQDEYREYLRASRYMPTVREALALKRSKVVQRELKNKENFVSMYEKAISRARKNVLVDIDNLRNGKGRVFKHVKDQDLEKLVQQDSELLTILKHIVEKDPVLSSRTLRGKVALALMIRSMMKGQYPNISEIISITGISRTHARRLLTLLEKRFERLTA